MPRGGKRPGSGRKKGGTNKITSDVKQAILEALNALGGVEYLCAVAREDPKAFCALLGKLIPAKVAGDEIILWCCTPRSIAHPTKPESSGLPEQRESGDYSPPQLWVPQAGTQTNTIRARLGDARSLSKTEPPGDIVVVAEWDRATRSMFDGIDIIKRSTTAAPSSRWYFQQTPRSRRITKSNRTNRHIFPLTEP